MRFFTNILALVLLFFLASCADEQAGGGALSGVTYTLRTGGAGVLSADDFESSILEMDVLVFRGNVFYQMVSAYDLEMLEGGGYECDFHMDPYPGPTTLVFVANARSILTGNPPQRGQTLAEVSKSLTDMFFRNGIRRDAIPMTAIQTMPSLTEDLVTYGMTMRRAVAKVDVKLEGKALTQLELLTVQVNRVNDSYRIIPDPDGLGGWLETPAIPQGAQNSVNIMPVACDGTEMESPIYLSESEWTDAQQATCVIIGGILNDNSIGTPTDEIAYWLLPKFRNMNQILRNKHYKIRITEMITPGHPDPGEIPDIDPIEFSVEVSDWEPDEFGGEGEYITVNSHVVNLHYFEGSTGFIAVNANPADYTVRWCDSAGNPTGTAVGPGDPAIVNGRFSLSVDADSKIIRAVALSSNGQSEPVSATARVTWGQTEFDIRVVQETKDMRGYVHIFNITGIWGNIGDDVMNSHLTNSDPFFRYGQGLREILLNKNNFGVDGTIPFEGYYISGLTFQTELNPHLLELFDVIYIPPATSNVVSNSEAANIAEWVTAKKNRVFYVQSDYNSNQNLLAYFGVTSTPISLLNSSTYSLSAEAPDFIRHGPFGSITGTMKVAAPGTAGYIDRSAHPWITPILVSSTNENEIYVGIDFEKNIVYHGDYRLYIRSDFTGLLTGNGIIEHNHDRFLANLWAWVAETVLES